MAGKLATPPAKKPDRRGCPKGKGTATGGSGAKTSGDKPKGKIGNPPFVATEEQRLIVELSVGAGWTQPMIAEKLGISIDTLTRHFRTELDEGLPRATARLGGVLYEGALAGDAKKLEMWFDRRGGPEWKKKTGLELSGPDGKPIETRDMTHLTDEQLAALAALNGDQ